MCPNHLSSHPATERGRGKPRALCYRVRVMQ